MAALLDRRPLLLSQDYYYRDRSDLTFEQRRDNLTAGIPDPTNAKKTIWLAAKTKTNPKGTVLDDNAVDQLLGGLGNDWFFPFGDEAANDG